MDTFGLRAKDWKGEPYEYAHAKIDGIRMHVIRGLGVQCVTPKTDITGQCRHCPWMAFLYALPVGTRVEGELYVPGKPASYVKSALAKREQMRYSVFAIPQLNHKPMHSEPLEWAKDICTWAGLEFAPFNNEQLSRRALLDYAEYFGYEGWVLKTANYKNWYKLKPIRTIDLLVTGTVDGEGKYLGAVGALVCNTADGFEIAKVSGMTDLQRYEMVLDDPTGRIVEVLYQYVGSQGRLRHPRFVRFRDDKFKPDARP